MGAQASSQPRSDHGEVISIQSLEDWNTRLQNSKTSNKLMVIDFWAEWCEPCKAIDPTIQELADRFSDVDFIKIDVDKLPNVAKTYEVKAMPTFVLLKKGKERDRIVGVKKDELQRMIEKYGS
ncbi:hypothetical protein E3N88_19836 [Mikania micrantha]|uniref:Thioredoxin domain-containing protein n=1 Tax=Mikania micrantha TaxID=192012 RepID=A0A5N6NQZ4_9ASTR|nr:hypothetical protein E3N88_19836 [Mikania micrantha]